MAHTENKEKHNINIGKLSLIRSDVRGSHRVGWYDARYWIVAKVHQVRFGTQAQRSESLRSFVVSHVEQLLIFNTSWILWVRFVKFLDFSINLDISGLEFGTAPMKVFCTFAFSFSFSFQLSLAARDLLIRCGFHLCWTGNLSSGQNASLPEFVD